MKKFLGLLGMAFLGGALTLGGYKLLFTTGSVTQRSISHPIKTITTNYNPVVHNKANSISSSVDFTVAEENTVN